jgi:hypothetical protein
VAARGGKLSLRSFLRGDAAVIRAQWRLLLIAALVVFVPVGLLEALDDRIQEVDSDAFTDFQLAALIAIAVVHASTALIGEVFYTGVVAAAVTETRTGTGRSLAHIARTLPYGKLVAADVLFAVAVVLGLVALVVPGILFFTWFALVAPVIELEKRPVLDAFRRSRELVRGNFWRILVLLLVFEVVTSALADGAGSLAGAILGDTLLADWLGAAVAGVLLTPLYAVAVVVIAWELIELESGSERPEARVTAAAGREETA